MGNPSKISQILGYRPSKKTVARIILLLIVFSMVEIAWQPRPYKYDYLGEVNRVMETKRYRLSTQNYTSDIIYESTEPIKNFLVVLEQKDIAMIFPFKNITIVTLIYTAKININSLTVYDANITVLDGNLYQNKFLGIDYVTVQDKAFYFSQVEFSFLFYTKQICELNGISGSD